MSRTTTEAAHDRDVQVDVAHYTNLKYLNGVRSLTHWHQVAAVAQCTPAGGHVLEVGPGAGHATWLLRALGYKVSTLDIAEDLNPDIVGDVTNLDIEDNHFDCVLAAEVLEHIPYDEFETALKELGRVSKGPAVITLPAPLIGFSTLINMPLLDPFGLSIGVPYWVPHKFDGEHYWELGKRGYGKGRIKASIRSAGLNIRKEYRPAPSLYTYVFVLQK